MTKRRRAMSVALALVACASASCRSGANDEASGIVVVNAPASGVVRRVLVSEGATVNEGAGVVEIVVEAQPQGELDGARATYERAQQRFQRAQTAAQSAQSGLVAARQQQLGGTKALATSPTPTEQIVVARASVAGRVSVLNVRVGETVTAGQPLATLRAGGE